MVNWKVSAALCVFAISLASVLAGAHDGKAKGKDSDDEKDDARIERGFAIAPVALHFAALQEKGP